MSNEPFVCEVADGLISLCNARVEIGLDAATGAIVLLRNRLTGSQHIARPGLASIFRIRCLLQSEMWVDAESSEQRVSRHSISDTEGGGKCVRLEYDEVTLLGSRGILGVVAVEVKLGPDDEEAQWTISVLNNGQGTLQEVWFPLIRGIQRMGRDAGDDYLILPDRSGERIADPLNTFGHHGDCVHIHYPKRASMQWMDLCDEAEGIYMVSYDKKLDCLPALHAEKEIMGGEASLMMSFVAYPYVPAGGTWQSSPFGVALHPGDWHWGADRYRAWATTWFGKPENPAWLAESNGLAIVIAMHQNGPVYYRFSELPVFFAEMQKLGVNMVYVIGWSGKGLDTLYPEYDPAADLGGEQDLKDAIAKIREMGGHTILYIQYRLMDVYSRYFAEGGRDWAMKSPAAGPRANRSVDIGERERIEEYRWAGRPRTVGKFALPCPYVKEWQEVLINEVVKVVRDLGADGVYFDQLASSTAVLCHDGAHGHSTPASHWAQAHRTFLQNLTGELKKIRPDFCIAGEGTNDVLGEYIHVHSGTVGPVIGESFPEVFRYSFPWHRIMQMGNQDNELIHAFATGRFLVAGRQDEVDGWNQEDSPEYVKLFRELADLKTAKGEYLLRGRFMDDVGLKVLHGGDSSRQVSEKDVLAKWHLAEDGNGALICAWNQTGEPLSAIVSLEAAKLSGDASASGYTVAVLYPESVGVEGPSKGGSWSAQDVEAGIPFSVPAGKLVVLELVR